ncbi:TIGR01906 family membrane protein [Sporolactobacillus pectinivorans]|uniref:TIGR01906 family membrane protein n=1 Tax=Sporolactobacillus pectinivorans TaxID=1591408 RepID=UPI000C266F2A|nr:TIGR01906 family membrane protein [Sporolactobacillus pectinivorans]
MTFSRYRLFQLMLSLSLALFIICLAVQLTLLFTPLYYFDVRHLNIMAQSGLSYRRIVDNYNYMIYYLLNPMPQPFHLPSLAYSVHGRIHFEDVKRIFTFIDILLIATLLINVTGFWIKIKHRDYYFLKTAAIALAFFTIVPLIAFTLDFNDSFIIFHKIFFRNNYWIFNAATDPVITILPETFFLHAALLVLGIIILGIIALTVFYRKLSGEKSAK